jgi:hypothetical protein
LAPSAGQESSAR